MKGLLADINDVKQVRVLVMLLEQEPRVQFWKHLGLTVPTFAELGLHPRSTDLEVWQKCQAQELLLAIVCRDGCRPTPGILV